MESVSWIMATSILLLSAIWLFYKISVDLHESLAPLKILFLIMSIILLIITSSLAIEIARDNGAANDIIKNMETFYQVIIRTLYLAGSLAFIFWLWSLFEMMMYKKRQTEDMFKQQNFVAEAEREEGHG